MICRIVLDREESFDFMSSSSFVKIKKKKKKIRFGLKKIVLVDFQGVEEEREVDRGWDLGMSVDRDDKGCNCGGAGAVNLHQISSIVRDIREQPCLNNSPIKVSWSWEFQ